MANWYQSLLNSLGLKQRKPELVTPNPDMRRMGRMMERVISTRDDEIGCDDCFDQLDEYVEKELRGEDPASLMPMVQDHLERCPDCHEEHDALIRALNAS